MQDDDGVTVTVRDRLTGHDLRHPREVRDRRRRRPQPGRRGRRPAVRGPDGRRRLDEHRLPRRPVAPRRAPAERPVLGAAARLERRRHRAGPGADGPAVERVADRLGLRHRRSRRPTSTTRWPRGSSASLVGDDTVAGDDPVDVAVGQQRDVRHPLPRRAGCSAWATPSTGTRRRTGWAPTPRSRTPTTWPGSSPTCSAGPAGEALLDTYDAERAPVGRQIVLRANKSIEEFGPIFEALGVTRHGRPGRDARAASRAARRHTPEARGQRDGAARGDGAQGLRVQRARRRARPALRVGRGRPRRHAGARVRPATPSCTTTRPPGPAPGCRTPGWAATAGAVSHPRPRRQGPVRAAHRHRRRGVGGRGREGRRPSSGSSSPRT